MSFDNRKWVIITLADHTDDELETLCLNAIQGRPSTLRKTTDGTKAILKWDGDTPSVFNGMTQYSHAEIKNILSGSDWASQGT